MEPLLDNTSCYYGSEAFDLDKVARRFEKHVPADVDTLVGVGLSGTLVVPVLAHRFGKHYGIVRKEAEMNSGHNHGSRAYVGRLGRRWAFVDDFVSSGKTRDRAKSVIAELGVPTAYVGTFMYGEWQTHWVVDQRTGKCPCGCGMDLETFTV